MIRFLACLFVVASLIGCGGSGKPKTYPVTGTVKYRGQPCPGALVVFHPRGAGRENDPKPVATVKDDGTFVISTFGEADGAAAGEYGITVVWNIKAKESKFSLSGEGGSGTDKLAGRYGDPRNPKLNATVNAAGPNTFGFNVD